MSTVPAPKSGAWAGTDVFTALNDELYRASQTSLVGPAWESHLLLLASATGAMGIAGALGRGSIGSVLELPAVQAVMVAAGAGMLIWSFKDSLGMTKEASLRSAGSRSRVPLGA